MRSVSAMAWYEARLFDVLGEEMNPDRASALVPDSPPSLVCTHTPRILPTSRTTP
jgi:hypothetical protein